MNSMANIGSSIMNANRTYQKSSSIRSARTQKSFMTTDSHFTRDTFNDQFKGRDQKAFINEANKIMRERMKNKGSTINSKSRLKSVVMNDTKEICLKNYLIGLLKEKRTDINEKERNITKALRDSENKLDSDYKNFLDFVEGTKKKQKKEEEELQRLKSLHEQKEIIYKKEITDYKKLIEDLERTVKLICLLKSYGSFVHKVLRLKFDFDNVPDIDSRERNFEQVSNIILKHYDNLKNSETIELLDDDNFMFMKFNELEERVVKILQRKELLDKESNAETESYKDEISELKRRVKDCQIESKQVQNEKDQIINAINRLKPQKDNEVNQYLDYIYEIGGMTGDLNNKLKGKKNITDLLTFTKDTLLVLQQKETFINDYITEIEHIEENGDKKLINDIITDRKKFNKREKQLQLKQKQEQIEYNKRKKAIDRAQRVVIKGRKVPHDYPLTKGKKKKKDDDKGNEDDYYAMLYYSSDDD
jgi:hypothetical protein